MAVAYPTTNEILIEQRRRLHLLELRQAREGRATPAEVVTEIADLKEQIAETGVPASDTERWTLLYDLVRELRADVRTDVRELRADVRRQWFLLPLAMLALCGLLILLVRL